MPRRVGGAARAGKRSRAALTLFRLLLGRRLPVTTGTLEVEGVRAPVSIRRDRHGIPFVDASHDEDAIFGLGFCHGQDRAFQIETLVRVIRGTLAELVGQDGVPVDRLSRRVGFRRAAERQWPFLDGDIRDLLTAYTRGVNAGAATGLRPHELALLRAKPTPMEPADAAAVLKLQSFVLPSNWDLELVRLKLLTEDGPDALAAIDPAYPEWLPVTSPPCATAGPAAGRLMDAAAALRAVAGSAGGSNNWAVSPDRSATGRPLLASDPHLESAVPPPWYLAHLRSPGFEVAGASMVGSPTFPVAHNQVAAWGITVGLVDNTDLFVEEIGADGRSVRRGGGFVPCEVHREVIRVKGGDDVVEEVLVTSHGPIVGPALDGEVGALALRATWLEPRPVRGMLVAYRARNFQEFRGCFEHWPGLSLNVVYADTSGKIGWQLVGNTPRRPRGNGMLPTAGWESDKAWEKEGVPFEELPHLDDPPCGFIATANNQPTANGDGPYLGADWIDGYRVARINEVLDARRDWDMDGFARLQLDVLSLPWRELRDSVLATPVDGGPARRAQALLAAWDGEVHAGSAGAAVFECFLTRMIRRIVSARAPRAAAWALAKGFSPLTPANLLIERRVGHAVRLLREQPADWLPKPWTEEIADALADALHTLEERLGPEPGSWEWGALRPLTFRHPFGERRPLHRVFELGPFPWGGDTNTVSFATTDLTDPSCNPAASASARALFDVGNWDACRFSLPGGQSGNPLCRHYDDLLSHWQAGTGVAIAWSQVAVAEASAAVLELALCAAHSTRGGAHRAARLATSTDSPPSEARSSTWR